MRVSRYADSQANARIQPPGQRLRRAEPGSAGGTPLRRGDTGRLPAHHRLPGPLTVTFPHRPPPTTIHPATAAGAWAAAATAPAPPARAHAPAPPADTP